MTDLYVTGARGQLGRALLAEAEVRGRDAVGSDVDTVDLRDPAAVLAALRTARPRTVVNCAAFTAVDACEEREAEAMAVNAGAVGHLAAACTEIDALLVHLSTDYVFDGAGARPYREDDRPHPVGAYGRTKLAGEAEAARTRRHLVVRTAWLFGRGGPNFVESIRDQVAAGRRELRVVADQRGCPTSADDLAAAILDLVAAGAQGTVHVVNRGETTWHGFAREVVRRLGAAVEVVPVSTAEVPRPAPRPAYSVLDTTRLEALIGRPMPLWQDALARYLEATCAS